MNHSIEEKNKALVIEAFEAAFNRRDPVAFDRYWSPNYLQHSAHIPPGRDGLRNLIASLPSTLKYEHGTGHGGGRICDGCTAGSRAFRIAPGWLSTSSV